jgi:hypothetical protein
VPALRGALVGRRDTAQKVAIVAIKRSSGRDVEYAAAVSLAFAGDTKRAQGLTDDLARRFPEDTIVQFNYLPTLRARLALNRANPQQALEILRAAAP